MGGVARFELTTLSTHITGALPLPYMLRPMQGAIGQAGRRQLLARPRRCAGNIGMRPTAALSAGRLAAGDSAWLLPVCDLHRRAGLGGL